VLVLAAAAAGATPFQPRDGAQVLEVLPWRGDPQQQELRRMRTALAARPADLARSTALAQRYIEAGRREGDPRYFGYAQAALAPWWKLPAPPVPVRLLRATLLQSVHRFDDALRDLDAVTAADPENAQAWLTRATVLTVRARYAEATASCAKLSSLAGQLVSLACIANVGALSGKLGASEHLLAMAFARGGGTSPDLDAWVLGALAEMAARRGESALARQRFDAAMRLTPRDVYLLGAYADFLLDQGQFADARTLLEPHRNVDGLLLRHALALRAPAEASRRAAEVSDLGARFAAAERRGDGIHLREQARFELELRGDIPRALALARRNWETQKELADAHILLRAAVHAHDRAAARPVLGWMRSNGVEAPQLAGLAGTLSGGAP
jgi:tetratricopeptide (TPR) repeat protein